MILIKYLSFKIISLRQVTELKFTGIGKVLSLLTGEHLDANSSLLSISNGGIKVFYYYC